VHTEALDESADQLRVAVAAQADTLDPSLPDMADWGRALTELIDRLGYAARVLAAQLAGYQLDTHDTSDTEEPTLLDDEGLDPRGRIADAIVHLHDAYAALNTASSATRAYHVTISHVRAEH
jgi:hypothetical protein